MAGGSWASILSVAIPAVIQSIAAPLTTTLQTAWLGLNGSVALAAFSAVNTSAVFAVKIFIFFTDGVAAKVGGTVGHRDWAGLRRTVRLSLIWSSSLGFAAAVFLLLIEPVVIHHLLDLEPDVLHAVSAYWTIRAVGVPVAMANMACSGILQGMHHVTLCAGLNTAQAIAESVLSALILLAGWRLGSLGALVSMGWATVLTQSALLVAGLVCIPRLLLKQQLENMPNESTDAPLLGDGLATDGTPSSPSMVVESNTLKDMLRVATSGPTTTLLSDSDEDDQDNDDDGEHDISSTINQQSNDDYTLTDTTGSSLPASPRTREKSSSRAFFSDGVNMLLRSITLQATFFAALVAASKLGTSAIAAHSVISQLWMLSAYAVDGFAAAGIVLGSRLAGVAARQGQDEQGTALQSLRVLVWRCCAAGTAFGGGTGVLYLLARPGIVPLFTAEPAVAGLIQGHVWVLLSLMQPINGLVFVLDGLMYASQAFAYVRNYMALGFAILFAPALGLELAVWPGLLGIWGAKALYNFWRAAGGVYLVFFRFLREAQSQAAGRRGVAEP